MESARGPFWSWCPWSPSQTQAQLKGALSILGEPAQDLPAPRHGLTQQLLAPHLHAALALGSRAHVTHSEAGSCFRLLLGSQVHVPSLLQAAWLPPAVQP